MYGYCCSNCKRWWACQGAPGQKFTAITRWCPDCLAVRLPVADLPPLQVVVNDRGEPALA